MEDALEDAVPAMEDAVVVVVVILNVLVCATDHAQTVIVDVVLGVVGVLLVVELGAHMDATALAPQVAKGVLDVLDAEVTARLIALQKAKDPRAQLVLVVRDVLVHAGHAVCNAVVAPAVVMDAHRVVKGVRPLALGAEADAMAVQLVLGAMEFAKGVLDVVEIARRAVQIHATDVVAVMVVAEIAAVAVRTLALPHVQRHALETAKVRHLALS